MAMMSRGWRRALLGFTACGALLALLSLTWGCAAVPIGGGSGQAAQRVDFYDNAGRRTGYAIIEGSRADFFKPNGVRAGSGVVGR